MCGSDSASLYLEVVSVDGQDIACEAKNGAVMDGLMTVSDTLLMCDQQSDLNRMPGT